METTTQSKTSNREYVRRITNVAALTAIGVILTFVTFPLFQPYLMYEPSDVPMLIISFMYGPLAGAVSGLIVSILTVVLSGHGGPFGAFMHFLATGTLVVVAGSVYRMRHTKRGALMALVAGTLSATVVMATANVYLNPIFYGIPQETVRQLLLPAIIPFNLTRSGLNSLITFILYKKVSNLVRTK